MVRSRLVYVSIPEAQTCPWGTPSEGQRDEFWSVGDVNRDGVIDQTDKDLISANQGWSGTPGSVPEDINSDGVVDIEDLAILNANWGMDICTYFEKEIDWMWILLPTGVGLLYTLLPYGLRA